MPACELCDGSGWRMVYTLLPRRQLPNGAVLTANGEPLSRERYLELAKRLPSSPLAWTPADEGVLCVESVPCVCRPAPRQRKRKPEPAAAAPRADPEARAPVLVETEEREPWWDK